MAQEVGFVLPEDAASSRDDVVFADVPGVWTPGVACPASTLALSIQEMRDLIKEHDLPLKETKADSPSEDELSKHAGMVSGAEAKSEPLGISAGPDEVARAAAEHAGTPLPPAAKDEED